MVRSVIPVHPAVVNPHGKQFDSFDLLTLRIAVQDVIGCSQAYSVVSEDGWPMFGCMKVGEDSVRLVATGWNGGGPRE